MVQSSVLTYINNWNRVYDDVLEKEADLKAIGINPIIINSATEEKESWLNIGDKWCYRQLFEFFKDTQNHPEYDYFSILFGDIYAPEGTNIADYVLETIDTVDRLPDCYVYSTSFTHDGWSYPGSILRHHNENVAMVCGTDTLYMTVHKEVANFCYGFLQYFDDKFGIDNFRSGWAIDVICSLYSIYNGHHVFRNLKSVLVHYENSGYDVSVAYQEMSKIIEEAIYYMNLSRGYDVNRLNNIKNMMFEHRVNGVHSYEAFYGNK